MKKLLTHLILVLLFVGCASQTKKVTSYYETEKIAEQGTYKNGKREGKWIYYYDKREHLIEEQHYQEGELNGAYRSFHWAPLCDEDNNIYYQEKEAGQYLAGKKAGTWTSYYKNGDVKEEKEYGKS